MDNNKINESLNKIDNLLLSMSKKLIELEYYISVIKFDNLEKHNKDLKLILENEKNINYLS